MRVLSDAQAWIDAVRALAGRWSISRAHRAHQRAMRPRVTPLRLIHGDEIAGSHNQQWDPPLDEAV